MARHVWGERSGWQAQKCQGLPCGMFATPLGVFYAISYHREVTQVIIGKWRKLWRSVRHGVVRSAVRDG